MHNNARVCVAVFSVLLADIVALRLHLMTSSVKLKKNKYLLEDPKEWLKHKFPFENLWFTWAKFDCFDGSLMVGRCALNWRLRVTDRANLANLDSPTAMMNWKKGNLVGIRIRFLRRRKQNINKINKLTTFCIFRFDGLLECCDIAKREQQQYH